MCVYMIKNKIDFKMVEKIITKDATREKYKSIHSWIRVKNHPEIPKNMLVTSDEVFCIRCKKKMSFTSSSIIKHSKTQIHNRTTHNTFITEFESGSESTIYTPAFKLYSNMISLGVPYYKITKVFSAENLELITTMRQLPSIKAFKSKLEFPMSQFKNIVIKYMEEHSYYSLIVDETSDLQGRYYTGVLYYNGEKTILLKLKISNTSFNAEQILVVLQEAMADFSLNTQNFKYFICDNASVMTKLHKLIVLHVCTKTEHLRCIAHTLNLVDKCILSIFDHLEVLLSLLKGHLYVGRGYKNRQELECYLNKKCSDIYWIETRWHTRIKALIFIFENFQKLKQFFENVIVKKTQKTEQITKIMNRTNIYKDIEAIVTYSNFYGDLIQNTQREFLLENSELFFNKIIYLKEIMENPEMLLNLTDKKNIFQRNKQFKVFCKILIDKEHSKKIGSIVELAKVILFFKNPKQNKQHGHLIQTSNTYQKIELEVEKKHYCKQPKPDITTYGALKDYYYEHIQCAHFSSASVERLFSLLNYTTNNRKNLSNESIEFDMMIKYNKDFIN